MGQCIFLIGHLVDANLYSKCAGVFLIPYVIAKEKKKKVFTFCGS